MATSFKTIWTGLKVKAKAVLSSDSLGEIETSSVTNKTYLHNGTTSSPLVTESQASTLTNKVIDADDNTISDLEVDNLKAGVLNTSTTLAAASNLQVPSALAVKTYVDNGLALQNQAIEITYDNTTSGLTATNVQAAIDEVDFDLDATQVILADHIADTSDAHDASAISNIPFGNLAATEVQAALNELQTDVDTRATTLALTVHLNDAVDAHDASAISVVPTGTLLATDVQSALIELEAEIVAASGSAGTVQTNLTNHINDTVDAHDGSAISNTPFGSISSTDVQAAINELDFDNTANATNLTNHLNDTSDAHDASAISSVASGNLAATDVQTALNELQSDIDLRVLTTGGSVISPLRLDFKKDTKANLVTYAITAANGQAVFATDTKEYFSVTDGLLTALGGGSGIASVDILSAEIADDAALSDFTQTGLEIVESPIVLHGTKSFRLQHATSIKSFKKVIAVDRKFRGKNNTISLDVASTATNANLNIVFRDETNSVNLGTSQAITTNSQAITATTANASNQLTAMTNVVLNTLKVGMVITGSAIPIGTTITAISSTAATMSQNATGVSTGIRISDVVAKKTFSVDIPANCLSFSWAISSVVEVATESYIDDIVVQLTAATLSSTSISTTSFNNTEWAAYAPTFTGFGTPSAVEFQWRQIGVNYEIRGKFISGTVTATESRITLPNGAVSAGSSIIPSLQIVGKGNTNNFASTFFSGLTVLIEPSVSYMTLGIEASSAAGLTKSQATTLGSTLTYSIFASVPITGLTANTTTSQTIPLTSAQLVQQSDSAIRLNTALGYGSTATRILRFTNIEQNLGTSLNYIASSINGDSVTILENGLYDLSFTWSATVASDYYISKNQSSLTSVPSISEILVQATTQSASGFADTASTSAYLNAGDIIRCSTDGGSVGGRPARLVISKDGSLKQLNLSSDSKITIPTHQLRFEGASARGSTDTAIVKFDTQAITQGDAWDVVNTAANGTVVTIKKAGRLSVSGTVYQQSASTYVGVSKNQANLTSATVLTSELVSLGYINAINTMYSISGFTDVLVGDKIRVFSGAIPVATNPGNIFTLSLTENSIPANFSNVLPQWSQSDSAVELNTANGFGSTATTTRRFSNSPTNLGTAITYVDSVADGAKFIINEDSNYNIVYNDSGSGVAESYIRINGVTKAVNTVSSANFFTNTTASLYLNKGDVVTFVRDTATTGVTPSLIRATISKVGKPNLTAVDVTPFVNMKTIDVEAIEALTGTSTFGATNTGVPVLNITKNTNLGVIRIDSSAANGTSFVALKDCELKIETSFVGNTASGQNGFITRNSTVLTAAAPNGILSQQLTVIAGQPNNMSAMVKLVTGDVIRIQRDGTLLTEVRYLTLTATADNNSIATPTQQVSSDTMSFAFKATTIVDADPVGTFNTYTYAINTNTATISASAPTQTVASMNADGVRIFARPFNAASTTASPARVDIKIGKGLKSTQVDAYVSAAKVNKLNYLLTPSGAFSEAFYTSVNYSETTGILTINAALNVSAVTLRVLGFDDTFSSASNGYFVFNASINPSLVSFSKTVNDARVISTAGTSIGNTVDVKVPFDATVIFQNGLSFDSANNRLIAGVAGEYSVLAGVQFQSALYAAGNVVDLKIYKNGVYYSTIAHKVIMAALTLGEGVSGSDMVRLNQNEYVEIFVFNNRTAGATNLTTTAGNNFLALAKQGL